MALILDFGGVLTTNVVESMRACARQEGVSDGRLAELLHADSRVSRLLASLERGEIDQPAFEAAFTAVTDIDATDLLARLCQGVGPDQAMLAAAARLRANGIRIGVLSNSFGRGPFDPYAEYGLDELAHAVVLSDLVGMRKPEPEIFELALDQLRVDPEAAVFVDDVVENLKPAADLGMRTIHHQQTSATIAVLADLFAVGLGPDPEPAS